MKHLYDRLEVDATSHIVFCFAYRMVCLFQCDLYSERCWVANSVPVDLMTEGRFTIGVFWESHF